MAERERGGTPAFADVAGFVRRLSFDLLPEDVVASARRSLLDLIGIAAAGSRTRAAQIVNAYAAREHGGGHGGIAEDLAQAPTPLLVVSTIEDFKYRWETT